MNNELRVSFYLKRESRLCISNNGRKDVVAIIEQFKLRFFQEDLKEKDFA